MRGILERVGGADEKTGRWGERGRGRWKNSYLERKGVGWRGRGILGESGRGR